MTNECMICMKEIEDDGERMMPCPASSDHLFCSKCFLDWEESLKAERKDITCPLCRTVVERYGTYSMRPAKLHGHYKTYSTMGNIMEEANYVNGLLHGEYKMNYDDGDPKIRCNYRFGKIHGHYVEYGIKGLKFVEVEFINNKMHGEYHCWNDDGKLIRRKVFEHGVQLLVEEY